MLYLSLYLDQPGILCSFKIPSAWSCAWCLNPQFDKTFSTGESLHCHLSFKVIFLHDIYNQSNLDTYHFLSSHSFNTMLLK